MALLQRILCGNNSISEVTDVFDKETHMPLGSGVPLFYHLMAQKIIRVDMLEQLSVDQVVVIQSIDESKLKKVKYE